MKKKSNHFYLSPETVMVEISSERVLFASSTLVDHPVGGVDNEEFIGGGTFTDWI